MGRTTFEDIWDEYLDLEPDERPQFLCDASMTLREQGNETAQRAVLYQAIEDAFEVGSVQAAANASVELSKTLSASDEHQEAAEVLRSSIERLPPWQGFELGLCFRALAWVYKSLGDHLRHEENLKISIAHFDSSALPDWAFPLRNELGELLLTREDWSSLADLLTAEPIPTDGSVAAIAVSIREYLSGRLRLRHLDCTTAIRKLFKAVVGLEAEGHRLLEQAIEYLAWAIQRADLSALEVLQMYSEEFGASREVQVRLIQSLERESALFSPLDRPNFSG
jgi:tetratricopeptide (TPR) repeat protein